MRRGEEPGRRGEAVDEEGGGEVLVEEAGLVLDLADDPVLPLEDLREQPLHRRRPSSRVTIPPWDSRTDGGEFEEGRGRGRGAGDAGGRVFGGDFPSGRRRNGFSERVSKIGRAHV